MNREEILNKLGKILSIKKIGNSTIITTNTKKYVIKNNTRKSDFYDYLLTRNFNNFPTVYTKVGDEIELMDYIEDNDIPTEQRLEDIIYLTSILHVSTTFDKAIDVDNIKEIYESLIDKQNSLMKYYLDIQNAIEEEVYTSPSNYLLIRNISLIYLCLNKSKEYLEKWYREIEKNKSIRYVYIHGNLRESHLIENNNLYLISWDKSRIDFPVFDLENFYRNSYANISLDDMLGIYEVKYPLKKEEKYLLFSLLLIPKKIDFKLLEYPKIKEVSNVVLYLESVLKNLENYSKKTDNNRSKQ